jgi:hypothetical protein
MRTKTTGRSRMPGILIAVCVALGLSAVPGMATAAPPHVSPSVDCSRLNADGTYTVVLGYTNTHEVTWEHNHESENSLSPRRFQGQQPTVFQPGTHPGVFSLQMTKSELSNFRWNLGPYTVTSRSAASPECAPSTPLPLLGNGTGLAIALAAGGVFGVFFVRRVVRRATAPAIAPA